MAKPRYDDLKSFLADRFGDSLRWVASFDSDSYTYNVRWIRDDLKTDLSNFDFDTIVHRSMAVFNRRHVEDVYFHLGDANSLVIEHERATAVHVYVDDSRGVVIKLEPDASVTIPEFRTECLSELGVE
ncbi:hypothetical protein QA599_11090 [Haloarculaceae archaeon H-GB1-1]|nr:hypothetical protein [Haloarculaceae archaeon H-GB1-1]